MDTTPAINTLHQSYTQARANDVKKMMGYDQFENMVVFFPCLLIAASDGVVDKEEWVYVQYLSRFMADPFKGDLTEPQFMKLKQDYYRELEFLVNHLKEWQGPFVNALKEHLEYYPEIKDTILDSLYLFAEASDGTSAVEQKAIDALVEKLKLEEEE